jgi:hypothetical protein
MELMMHGYESLACASTITGQATSFGVVAELDGDGELEFVSDPGAELDGGLDAVP